MFLNILSLLVAVLITVIVKVVTGETPKKITDDFKYQEQKET